MGVTPERGPGRKSCEQTEQGERGAMLGPHGMWGRMRGLEEEAGIAC